MVLLIAALGGYGLYVLQAAGGFVVEVYDRPLMAINYGRAASLDFAEMDKEVMRREAAGTDRERAAIDARTTRHAGYTISMRIRKRIEEIFGWAKTIGGFRRTRYRGVKRTQQAGYFVGAAYNLLRIANLSAAT